LEKEQHGDHTSSYRDLESNEYSALNNQADRSNTDSVFIPLLNQELKKIVLFYESQEKELLDEVVDLEELIEKQEEEGLAGGEHYLDDPLDDDDDDDDDESISRSPDATRTRRRKLSSQSRSRGAHGQ
jgi:phosphate transporter